MENPVFLFWIAYRKSLGLPSFIDFFTRCPYDELWECITLKQRLLILCLISNCPLLDFKNGKSFVYPHKINHAIENNW